MAENIALPIVTDIVKCLATPVCRQFGYLIFYERNIENLREQVKKLEDKRSDIQGEVDAAKSRSESIKTTVERWLTQVDELSNDANKFFEDEVIPNKGCLNGWCPNLKSRYSLSRKATKKTQIVEELCGEGGFSRVSYPAVAPSVGTTFAFSGGFKGFESRRLIMNGVMEALTDDSICVIGICGMGGVGKTTMVREVAKKAEEKKMFDKIVMVVVSPNPDLINIQGEIAKILGLDNFGGNSLYAIAGKIRSKILSVGRVLVILDDVWKRLELNDIGIPFGDNHKGCKIVMTSRSEDVCNGMDTQKNFKVGVLYEEEAWNLFKEMAGISDEGISHPTNLQLTQMAVAKHCGGLPMAIITVGRALRCKNKYSWDSTLEQLQKSKVKSISGVDENVFKSLELSYDFLDSDEAKKCFLLCSLYPKDFDIPIEYLVRYVIGIELFQSIDSVHQARNIVYSIVNDLKTCCLLMESEEVECIKMHGLVRDVAISIASREEHSFLVRCDEVLKEWPEKNRLQKNTVISLKVNGMHWLPGNLEFPNLQLLQLDCNAGLPPLSVHDLNEGMMEKVKVQETPDSFYQGMKELKVLALLDMYSSLPTSLQCLTNLRTLSLFCCRLIDDDISTIIALENLEILSFAGSYIKELPKEIIGHLAHLKVLDLLGCVVERIYPGVLSSLSKLEELYVGSIFRSWCKDEKRKEGAKAIIDELASLSNLVALDIDLINSSFWPRGLVVEKLKKFNVTVGHPLSSHQPCYPLSNQLELRVENMSDFIDFLSKSTEFLTLVDEDGFECVTKLSVRELYDLEYLINTADGVPQSAFPVLEILDLQYLWAFKGITSHECRLPNAAFSALKVLRIEFLPQLRNLWKGPTQLVWLGNLTSVEVWGCDKLESMFSLSIARDLVQLQVLQIRDCDVMEEIVSSEGGEHEIATDKIEFLFPKLKELFLSGLPSFTAICKAMNVIELPQLRSLRLDSMPKLKRLWVASDSESNYDPIIQPLFNDKVVFPALEELRIDRLPKITEIWYKKLLPSESFGQLRYMTIRNCQELKLIVLENGEEEVKVANNNNTISFPQLTSLTLEHLQSLESFCTSGSETQSLFTSQVIFPALEELRIDRLLKITEIWYRKLLPSESYGQLRYMAIRNCQELKVIVLENGEEEVKVENNNNTISFPQLTSLTLEHLQSLESFCTSRSETQSLFTSQVIFPALEELRIDRLLKITEIWYRKLLPSESYGQLRYMAIRNCQELKVIVLENGEEEVKVENNNNTISFPQLTSLTLEHLQSLESFCTSRSETQSLFTSQVIFPALEELRIDRLLKITEIWYRKLLPSESYGQLRYMTIRNCQELKVIVLENGEEEVKVENNNNTISFPQLTSLTLEHLQSLESFCTSRSETQSLFTSQVAFPALEELLISGVPNITEIWGKQFPSELKVNCFEKLMNAVQSNMLPRLQNLRKLSENAKKKAMAQEKKRNDDVIVFPQLRIVRLDNLQNLEIFCRTRRFETQTLFNHQIACPELRVLTIGWLPNITDVWDKKLPPTGSFCQLREVRIEGCDKLVNVILSNMLPRLQNLTELSVQYCPMVEEILSEKGEEKADAEAEENIILFPQLKTLELGSLENLKSFCTSRLAAQHFFKHPVAFASLKELHICNLPNITKIWGKQLLPVPKPGAQSFEKLAVLNATWCEKLVNVIPSSMFPRLQNLKSIYVKGCPEMEVIVSKKANATENGDIILFAQLSSLSIDKLYNLKSFCSSSTSSEARPLFNDQVAFPVLEDLFINRVRNITKIWDKLPSESFCLLKRMMIEDCEKLVNVVPSYMLPQLQNLKVLSVYSCLKMLAIVSEEEGKEKDVDENTILFPKLTTLNLKSLDNLKTFYTQPFLNYQVALPKLKNPCLDQYLQQQQLLKGKECAIMNENDDKEIDQDKQRLLKGKEFEIMNENDDKETEQDKRRRLKGKEFRNYE